MCAGACAPPQPLQRTRAGCPAAIACSWTHLKMNARLLTRREHETCFRSNLCIRRLVPRLPPRLASPQLLECGRGRGRVGAADVEDQRVAHRHTRRQARTASTQRRPRLTSWQARRGKRAPCTRSVAAAPRHASRERVRSATPAQRTGAYSSRTPLPRVSASQGGAGDRRTKMRRCDLDGVGCARLRRLPSMVTLGQENRWARTSTC